MRGFSDAERDRIRRELLESGRSLFVQFGLERTRIADLTDQVGIGTSTFYQFFDSKEALYTTILIEEQAQLNATLAEAVADIDEPREQATVALELLFESVEQNPLIARLIVDGELAELERKVSPENKAAYTERAQETTAAFIDEWVEQPGFPAEDPAVVHGLFRSIVFVTRSKSVFDDSDEFGSYEDVRDFLIETIVAGLFDAA